MSNIKFLIKELLFLETVSQSHAVLYTGSELPPEDFIPILTGEEPYIPGMGEGSNYYGRGLYTIHDFHSAHTNVAIGKYGPYIYKLKSNLYGCIIFDTDIAKKVYGLHKGKPLSVVQQGELLGLSDSLIQKLKTVNMSIVSMTSHAARYSSKFLKGKVKGLVFTGGQDGRVVVLYDADTVVPIAWAKRPDEFEKGTFWAPKEEDWNPVSKENISGLRKKGAKDVKWELDKYSNPKIMELMFKIRPEKRTWRKYLDLEKAELEKLPDDFKCFNTLNLRSSSIKTLPNNLYVQNDLILTHTKIMELPSDLRVGRSIIGFEGDIYTVPQNLRYKLKRDRTV